jgi:hypothetical protein
MQANVGDRCKIRQLCALSALESPLRLIIRLPITNRGKPASDHFRVADIRREFLFPRKGLQTGTWGKKLYAGLLHASLHQSLEGRASLGDLRETGVRALEM